MADPPADVLTRSLLRKLRVAAVIVVSTILAALVVPNMLLSWELYSPAWAAAVGLFVLMGITAGDAALVWRHREWGRRRWPVAFVALLAGAIATSAVPDDNLIDTAHQTLGFVGWIGVLLFAETSLPALLTFLGLHGLLTVAHLAAIGGIDDRTFVRLGLVFVGTAGFQLALGLAGAALRRVAAATVVAATRQAELRTSETIAQTMHDDREHRYEALRGSVVPLLEELATGILDPRAHATQRRCAIEAARLRRLFAEDGDLLDPLVEEIAALIDVAERKGIVVRLSTRGPWAQPPPQVRRVLLDELAGVLLNTDGPVRVTVSGEPISVTVSAVADGARLPVGKHVRDGVVVSTISEPNRAWLEALWTSAS